MPECSQDSRSTRNPCRSIGTVDTVPGKWIFEYRIQIIGLLPSILFARKPFPPPPSPYPLPPLQIFTSCISRMPPRARKGFLKERVFTCLPRGVCTRGPPSPGTSPGIIRTPPPICQSVRETRLGTLRQRPPIPNQGSRCSIHRQ